MAGTGVGADVAGMIGVVDGRTVGVGTRVGAGVGAGVGMGVVVGVNVVMDLVGSGRGWVGVGNHVGLGGGGIEVATDGTVGTGDEIGAATVAGEAGAESVAVGGSTVFPPESDSGVMAEPPQAANIAAHRAVKQIAARSRAPMGID